MLPVIEMDAAIEHSGTRDLREVVSALHSSSCSSCSLQAYLSAHLSAHLSAYLSDAVGSRCPFDAHSSLWTAHADGSFWQLGACDLPRRTSACHVGGCGTRTQLSSRRFATLRYVWRYAIFSGTFFSMTFSFYPHMYLLRPSAGLLCSNFHDGEKNESMQQLTYIYI